MDTLLNRIAQRHTIAASDQWRRYAQLLHAGDDAPPGAEVELDALMRDLGLTPASVRQHAFSLSEARKHARSAADDPAAARNLREIHTAYPFLFWNSTAPADVPPSRWEASAPPTIDDRLLALDLRALSYSAAELERAGLPSRVLSEAHLSKLPDGQYFGASIVDWARRCRQIIRCRRRAALKEERQYVDPKWLTVPPVYKYTDRELLADGFPQHVLHRLAQAYHNELRNMGHKFSGSMIRDWAQQTIAANKAGEQELSQLDALDAAEPPVDENAAKKLLTPTAGD